MKHSAIFGEPLCYLVESESHPGEHYKVDLVEDECGCRDWVCRHRQYRESTSRPYRCKHIKALREIAIDEIIEHIKEQSLAK